MASLIPDAIKDTLGDVLSTYADIQSIKLQTQAARAQASLNWANAANITEQQAAQNGSAAAVAAASRSNGLLLVGAALVAVVAAVMLVK